jgi:hypothetical protein
MNEYDGVEGFIPELKATVRECIDCGALIAGGPTRCVRCAKEGAPSNKGLHLTYLAWASWGFLFGMFVTVFAMLAMGR